jgi:toxin YoeB
MRKVSFYPGAFKDYVEWSGSNTEIFEKINELIKEIQREPFKGKGKPEPLKGNHRGSWSRRINLEHRLVYVVTSESVTIIACHGHYE